jgi:hypothetical protein
MTNETSWIREKTFLIRELLEIDPQTIEVNRELNVLEVERTRIENFVSGRDRPRNVTEVKNVLQETVDRYEDVECFLETYRRESVDPPTFSEIPESYHIHRNDEIERETKTLVEEAYVKLGEHLLDYAEQRGILSTPDCPNCIGDCSVHRSRKSTIRLSDESMFEKQSIVIPCITNETKKLTKYAISEVRCVSSFRNTLKSEVENKHSSINNNMCMFVRSVEG